MVLPPPTDSARCLGRASVCVTGNDTPASSTSAELKAISVCALAVQAMRLLLNDIGRPMSSPTYIINDSKPAITVAENPGALRTAMTHLSTSVFKVRELVSEQLVKLLWAPTDRLAADLLTKNLGVAKFRRFQRFVLGLPYGQPVRALVERVIRSWG